MRRIAHAALSLLLVLGLYAPQAQALYKNVAGQDICLLAYDTANDTRKTGDAANIDFYVDQDNAGTGSQIDTGTVTEIDATNMPGVYCANLSQADTNGDLLVFSGTSGTASIEISSLTVYTRIGDNTGVTVGDFVSGSIDNDASSMDGSELTVTAGTVSDKTGYSLATAPPTATQIQAELEEDGASLLDTLRDRVTFVIPGDATAIDSNVVEAAGETVPATAGTGNLPVLVVGFKDTEFGVEAATGAITNNFEVFHDLSPTSAQTQDDVGSGGGGDATAANQTEILARIGDETDAASTGDPGASEAVIPLAKQLVNVLVGSAGVATFPTAAAPADGASLAEVLRAAYDDTNSLDGTKITFAIPGDATAVDSNPVEWAGTAVPAPEAAGVPNVSMTHIHGDPLTETDAQLAGRFVDFFDQASAGFNVNTALSSFQADVSNLDVAVSTRATAAQQPTIYTGNTATAAHTATQVTLADGVIINNGDFKNWTFHVTAGDCVKQAAQVKNSDATADTLTFPVGDGFHENGTCAVDADLDNQPFELIPPGVPRTLAVKEELGAARIIRCTVDTANFTPTTNAGPPSRTTFACDLTDVSDDSAITDKATGDLEGQAVVWEIGAVNEDEYRVIPGTCPGPTDCTTWDGTNNELQITVMPSLSTLPVNGDTALIVR